MSFAARLTQLAVFCILMAALIANTLAFGGVAAGAAFCTQMLILAALVLQVPLLFFENDYFADGSRRIAALFVALLLFACQGLVQHAFGPGHAAWMPGSLGRYPTHESVLHLAFYAVFFWLCLKTFSHRRAVEKTMILMAFLIFVVTSLGLLQRLSDTTKVYWIYEIGLRSFFGPFVYENNYGAFLCLALPLAAALGAHRTLAVIRNAPPSGADWRIRGEIVEDLFNSGAVFFIFLIGFSLCGALFSQARAAAISICFFFTLFFFAGAALKKRRRWMLPASVGIVLAVFAIILAYPGQWLSFYDPTLMGANIQTRFDLYGDSIRIFFDNPLFGVGLGTYWLIAPQYLTTPLELVTYLHANNDYIELAAETGIAGVCLVGLFMAIVASQAAAQYPQIESRFCKMLWLQAVLALCAFSVTLMFDSHLKLPVIPLFCLMQFAILLQARRIEIRHEKQSAGTSRENPLQLRYKVLSSVFILAAAAFLGRQAEKSHSLQALLSQEESVSSLTRAASLAPDDTRSYTKLAKLHYQLAKTSRKEPAETHFIRAIEAARKCTELSPAHAHFWFVLGQFEYLHGDRRAGIAALEGASDRSPSNRRYAAWLLSVYLKEYEKVVSTTKKEELWAKSMNLWNRMIAVKGVPNPTVGELQTWMMQYNEPLVQRLQSSISIPSKGVTP